MAYVKDADHAVRVEVVHVAYRPDGDPEVEKTICLHLSTASGLEAVTLGFDSKGKRNTFWDALLAALT